MVASKTKINIIAGSMLLFGIGLTLYKSFTLGLPLLPDQYQNVWTIESKSYFRPTEGPIEIDLALPDDNNGWLTLNEHFSSSGFGFTVQEGDAGSHARWTRASQDGPTTLYYKMQVYKTTDLQPPDFAPEPEKTGRISAERTHALESFIRRLRAESANDADFVRLTLQEFLPDSESREAQYLLASAHDDRLDVILQILAFANIAAHKIKGIELEDGRRRQTLKVLFEVHDGSSWVIFDPNTAEAGVSEEFYLWKRGDKTILSVIGGGDSKLEFALVKNNLPLRTIVSMEEKSDQFALLDFSIYSLPVEQQGVFKGLLLIPVAALVVVFMRIVIGLSTSGTFMPILIALAFIQTTLLAGLAIFLVVVGAGLWIRSYLSHMNLLLVSRVASVVIVVILLMAVVAVLSYKLGIDQALTVTFFPTIILAWTIERMSILWEEEGGHEVLIQGGGSLLVAVLAYLVMSNQYVEHLTFNFPELLITLLGVTLMLGKYTGYRLSELYRFREMKKKS